MGCWHSRDGDFCYSLPDLTGSAGLFRYFYGFESGSFVGKGETEEKDDGRVISRSSSCISGEDEGAYNAYETEAGHVAEEAANQILVADFMVFIDAIDNNNNPEMAHKVDENAMMSDILSAMKSDGGTVKKSMKTYTV
ncbi:hypothetical protein PTKIN_Ptkin06aG0166100 [Pterospermum kingtungense]